MWERLSSQLPDDALLILEQRITADGAAVEADPLVLWPGIGIAVSRC